MSSIIWLASYPKSGNTWIRAFLQNYLDTADGPSDINALNKFFADESKPNWYVPHTRSPVTALNTAQICELRPRVHRDIATSRAGSVLVKTHNFLGAYNNLPLHEMTVTAGAVYIVRNPLDVVLSVADHFGLSIDTAIEFMNSDMSGSPTDEANVAGVFASWSTHVRSWIDGGGDATHVVRYEDLLDDPEEVFGGVVRFLGLKSSNEKLKKAVRFSSFGELRKQEDSGGFIERSPNSKRFFRRGRKDQWRTELSAEQAGRIIDSNRELMQRLGYLPDVH